jgi:DNA-binding transcriptional regulator of glucitol operon
VNRSLLTPRWLLLHALFVAAVIATGLLAWWQWDRAHDAGGSFQNLGYALQWPLFGVFTLFFWYRLTRLDRSPAPQVQPGDEEEDDHNEKAEAPERKRPLVPPPAPSVDDNEDPELAAYNRYLAELNDPGRSS